MTTYRVFTKFNLLISSGLATLQEATALRDATNRDLLMEASEDFAFVGEDPAPPVAAVESPEAYPCDARDPFASISRGTVDTRENMTCQGYTRAEVRRYGH